PNIGEYWDGATYAKQVTSFKSGEATVGTTWPYQVNLMAAEKPPLNVTAKVAEYFGEAPSNAKACDLTTNKNHCADYHADDEAYWENVYYWDTPQADC